MTKEELQSALDEEQANHAQTQAALDKAQAALEKAQNANVSASIGGNGPDDLANYKGKHKNKAGEVFGLKVLKEEDAPNGKTHQLKNVEHFLEMTEDEYRLEFTKKGKDEDED